LLWRTRHAPVTNIAAVKDYVFCAPRSDGAKTPHRPAQSYNFRPSPANNYDMAANISTGRSITTAEY
jgi:hypothetical protein